MKEKFKNVILDSNLRIEKEIKKEELSNEKQALHIEEPLKRMGGDDKMIIKNNDKIKKPMEEKVRLMIDLCTNKNQLLKLRKILVEFENDNLINEKEKRKEMIKNDERKIKRK